MWMSRTRLLFKRDQKARVKKRNEVDEAGEAGDACNRAAGHRGGHRWEAELNLRSNFDFAWRSLLWNLRVKIKQRWYCNNQCLVFYHRTRFLETTLKLNALMWIDIGELPKIGDTQASFVEHAFSVGLSVKSAFRHWQWIRCCWFLVVLTPQGRK